MAVPNRKEMTMKTRKSKRLLIGLFAVLVLLLSACQVNFITEIKSNGAGMYTQEIGFQGDEASMAGLSGGGDDFCAKQNEDMPPGTKIRQETRNETETWCIYETPFKSLDELRAIYATTDTRINDLSLADGRLTYDLSLDLSGDSSAPMGAEINWIVKMPGKIVENNAHEQDGNTLKWKMAAGMENNIRAVSEVGGLSFGGDTFWYILGGAAVLCLCCFVPLVVGVVVFILLRRKKETAVKPAAE